MDKEDYSFSLRSPEATSNLLNNMTGDMMSFRRILHSTVMDNPHVSFADTILDLPRKQSVLFDESVSLTAAELARFSRKNVSSNLTHITRASSETDHLYMQFLESLQLYSYGQHTFGTVANFTENCSDVIKLILDKYKYTFVPKEYIWLINERNTWSLIKCLYEKRANTEAVELEDSAKETYCPESEKEIVANLFRNDTCTRECQLVIDWLEESAFRSMKQTISTDQMVSWENTLHELQNNARSIAYASTHALVSKLDPDAPVREGKSLHNFDMGDEEALLKNVFLAVRCGSLDRAQQLCMLAGHPWRAAIFEGWKLFHDPNFDTEVPVNEKKPVEGNPNRDLWKLHAWQYANNQLYSIYDRATMGVLCGHVESILAVCSGWTDALWAYLRTLVDIRVEKEIRAYRTKSHVSMPEEYWQNNYSLEEIFNKLSASTDETIRQQANDPFSLIQKFLILDDIPKLMALMNCWKDESSFQLKRFMAHLVIFFRLVGRCEIDEVGNSIIESYITILMEMEETKLVAYYTSLLPAEYQTKLFSIYLEAVRDSEKRKDCMFIGKDFGLDIEAIAKIVVINARTKVDPQEGTSLQGELTSADEEKISALKLLILYDSQRAEAIWQANALIRSFIAANKLEAARKTFEVIPYDSIDLIMEQYKIGEGTDYSALLDFEKLPPKVACSIREYMCYKIYLDALESFSEWFHIFHNEKPTAPDVPSGDVAFTEKVAFSHRESVYRNELVRWRDTIQNRAKLVKSQLYNVLTFPHGGWLVDPPSEEYNIFSVAAEDDEFQNRNQQMKQLRQLCIPKVTMLLHSLLSQMDDFEECIELADLIVSDRHHLYRVFPNQILKDLLVNLAESSVALLNVGKDPWGINKS